MTAYFQSDIWVTDAPNTAVPFPAANVDGQALQDYLSKTLYPAFEQERTRLQRFEQWGTGQQPEVRPLKRNTERAVLQKLARTPWLPLAVTTFAQQMIVDGYRKEGETTNSPGWKSWLRNKMTMQQIAINRATMVYGYAYVRVTDGAVGNDGSKMAVMRAMSPMDFFALYEDAYLDEYPKYGFERLPDGTYRFWTPEGDYFPVKFEKNKFVVDKKVLTDYGCPPFVRYINQIDLRGRCWGDVEPILDLAARIDKTAFDRLMVQHFNSFKVRWATGLEQADTAEGVEQDKIRIGNEDILIASDMQAKFGTLDETQMSSFIEAYKSDLETFAAVMQLPPNLFGQVVNVTGDALDGARRQTYQRLFEKQIVMAESHGQVLRLAALIEGRDEDAEDFYARVTWQDVEVRSLAQFADAWGKLVTQLGIPKQVVWSKIPGIEATEAASWEKMALDEGDKLNKYLRDVVGKSTTDLIWDDEKEEAAAPPVNMDAIEAQAKAKAAAAPAGNPGNRSAKGGSTSTQNQRPVNKKTGANRGTAT